MADRSIVLTPEEKRAIEDLLRLAKRWPKSLWLFSNGTITVLKCKPDGSMARCRDGGVDADYDVGTIPGIHSEGGDW